MLMGGFTLVNHNFDDSAQMTASPRYSPMDRRGIVPGDLLIHKLEEVNKSVKVLSFVCFSLSLLTCMFIGCLCNFTQNFML